MCTKTKLALAWPIPEAEVGKFPFQHRSVAPDFRGVPSDIFLISKRLRKHRERYCIDVVRRCNAADHLHLSSLASENADAQARQAVSFGKSPRHEQVRRLSDSVDDRFITSREIRNRLRPPRNGHPWRRRFLDLKSGVRMGPPPRSGC